MHLSRRSVVYTSIQYIAVFFGTWQARLITLREKSVCIFFFFLFFHVFFGTWQARLITLREKVGNKFVHALRNVYLLSEDGTIPVDDVARNLYGNRGLFIWQKRSVV